MSRLVISQIFARFSWLIFTFVGQLPMFDSHNHLHKSLNPLPLGPAALSLMQALDKSKSSGSQRHFVCKSGIAMTDVPRRYVEAWSHAEVLWWGNIMTRLETKNYGDVANKFPEDEQRCGKSRIKCLSWDLYIAYLGEFIGGWENHPGRPGFFFVSQVYDINNCKVVGVLAKRNGWSCWRKMQLLYFFFKYTDFTCMYWPGKIWKLHFKSSMRVTSVAFSFFPVQRSWLTSWRGRIASNKTEPIVILLGYCDLFSR